MNDDDLPLATRHPDGTVTVPNERNPFRNDAIRTFHFTVGDLSFVRGFSVHDGATEEQGRLRGTAVIERDSIAVAGLANSRTQTMPFSVRAVPDDSKHAWRAHIGYLGHDWEIGGDADYFVEAYAPRSAFEKLERAIAADRVRSLSVSMDSKLWIVHHDWYEPPSGDVTWYLIPEETRASNSPQSAYAHIKDLSWSERVGPVVRKEEQPAYRAGQAAAQTMLDEAEAERRRNRPTAPSRPPPTSKWKVAGWIALIVVALVVYAIRNF